MIKKWITNKLPRAKAHGIPRAVAKVATACRRQAEKFVFHFHLSDVTSEGIPAQNKKNQKGSGMLVMTILLTSIVFIVVISISFITFNRQRISINSIKSIQAYYAAESGIEDGLLRISRNMNFSSPYSLEIGKGITNVEISEMIGGSVTITSEGDVQSRLRKERVIYSVDTQKASFFLRSSGR